jgi:hypothetical protein
MVRRVLQRPEFEHLITGKFTMSVEYNDQGRQRLHVHCELRHGQAPSPETERLLIDVVHANLIEESSEYRETHKMIGGDVEPVIHLWPYEDPIYFRPGTKQKWVVK